MDWNIFWCAGGVVVSLSTLIIGCFRSLSRDINNVDQRLSRLEGSFEERNRWEVKKRK